MWSWGFSVSERRASVTGKGGEGFSMMLSDAVASEATAAASIAFWSVLNGPNDSALVENHQPSANSVRSPKIKMTPFRTSKIHFSSEVMFWFMALSPFNRS